MTENVIVPAEAAAVTTTQSQEPVVPRRRAVFEPDFVRQAYIACADLGADQKRLGKLLGVRLSTVESWMRRFPEFRQAIVKGREVYDANVEVSILKRALGYTYIETTVRQTDKGTFTTTTTKHMPGDVVAQIFWLKNRHPDRWHDRQEHSVSGQVLNIAMSIEKSYGGEGGEQGG